MKPVRTWTLMGSDGRTFSSPTPGAALGGNRANRIYGRLDCRVALQAIARGGYKKNRVFFPDERTAIVGGFRPCAVCMPEEYARWKAHD
jgi:methylphosphotriester-DNA--protein-cysteine methyltransferase